MKKFYLLIILMLFFPGVVDALSLECPTIVTHGEEFICKVTEQEMVGLKARYEVEDVFTYLDFKMSSPWKSYYTGGLGFAVGNILDDTDLSGELHFKVGNQAVSGKEYVIQLVEIEGSNSLDQVVVMENVTSKVKVVSDVNTLSSLKISNVSLSPEFRSNVMSYFATVKEKEVVVEAMATDSSAKIEGDIGKVSLQYGVNTLTIRVTSERGNVREYKVYITRVSKSQDTTLKSLKINGKEISFPKDEYYYSYEVENSVETLDVEAVLNSQSSKVEIMAPDTLIVGENTVTIRVTAEDGTVCNYVVLVIRKRLLSSDNTIQNILIDGYDLDFSSDIDRYDLVIENDKKLKIEVILNDLNASYVIKGNQNLKSGDEIEIVVTAENGDQKSYFIKVMREVEANSDSLVNSLKIFPLVGFVILISVVLIVKKVRGRVTKGKA